MKKRYLIIVVLLVLLIIPIKVLAKDNDDNEFVIISETTRYYKTIELKSNLDVMALNHSNFISRTYEITEDEYNSFADNGINPLGDATITTEYKKMTTSILKSGSLYRYKNVLVWNKLPKIRSYDIIGIGFMSNVKIKSNLVFTQEACTSLTDCTKSTTNYPQKFSNGAGTTFKLPVGDFVSLTQTLYFDVEKNTLETIISQNAYGDYAHATSTISLDNAKKYTVNGSQGIVLNTSIKDSYDTINQAKATWTGSW